MEPEISHVYRDNLAAILQHALHQNKRRVRSTGEIAKGATGAREMAGRVLNILKAYGIDDSPSDTTLRRWGNAHVADSFKGVGPQGLSEDALGRLAIALQIYPAEKIAGHDLSQLGERQRMLNQAAIYAKDLLNRKGGADEWLNSEAAENWLKGPVVGEHIKPAVASLSDVDLTVLSNPELRQLHEAVGDEWFKRTAYERPDRKSEPHLPGKAMAALIESGQKTFDDMLQAFNIVEPLSADELNRVIYQGEPMSERHCHMAAVFLSENSNVAETLQWLIDSGACAKTNALKGNDATPNRNQ